MKILFPRLSRIALEDWLNYHPYDKEVSSDHFYVGLSNDIQHEIFHIDVNDNLVGADYKYLSCMLACYFEDIISQTGIWTSFIKKNHSLYGKYLPFYNTSDTEYECGEINLADVQFLIWHFCSNLSIQNHFIDPYSLEGEEMAQIVYSLLNEQAGLAPRNEDLKKALLLAPDANIYQVKKLMDYFFFGSYLNYYYMMTLMEEDILELKNQKGANQNMDTLIYDKRLNLLFNAVSPILAQHSGEMLANWIGDSHPLCEKLKMLSKRKEGIFRYKGTTSSHLQMEHIASGIMVEINTTNMPGLEITLVEDKTCVKMGIVQWDEEWWIMGPVFPINDPSKEKVTEKEKALFAPVASQLGVVRRQEECFHEMSQGNNLMYFNSKKAVFTFIDEIWDLYHRKYGRDSMDRKMFDVHDVTFEVDDDLENVVIFFNVHAGLEFYPDIAQCISEARNPYFDLKAEADIEQLMLDELVSPIFINYLIKNQMIEIEPISGSGGFQYVWDNCDFLLRYWKKERYISEPKLFIE